MTEPIHLPRLSDLLGLNLRFRGEVCVVVEILEDPAVLVLCPRQAHMIIQADAHGRPSSVCRSTYQVQVLTVDRLGLSDDLLELELLD